MDVDKDGGVSIKAQDGGYCNHALSLELEENGANTEHNQVTGEPKQLYKPKSPNKSLDLPEAEEKRHNLTIIVEDEDGVSVGDDNGEKDPDGREQPLLYKIGESPPISLTLFFGFQQTLLSIVGSLIVPFLVADAVCAQGDNVIVTRLLSTTMMLNGITSLFQTVLGVRLPLFQGPSASYIVPLQSLNIINPERCQLPYVFPDNYVNGSLINGTSESDLQSELINLRLQELIGPLVICGVIHCLVGFTGLVGFLMRFVGPITIIPTLVLIGIYIVKPTIPYVESNWAVALFTWATSIILSLYLGGKKMPIPCYSRENGFTVIRYPLHQVFALLISIILGWALCGILTAAGALTDDPRHIGYKARTDARAGILTDSPWFTYLIQVASRRVFITMSLFYIMLGLFSKVSAIFVSIPYPVLGGVIFTVVGVFIGLNLSNLQVVDLSSTRNLSIMGMGIFIGYFVPTWIEKNPNVVFTGNPEVDEAIKVILGNPNFVGTVLSCFLDNTIAGTAEERGIAAWRDQQNEANKDAENGDSPSNQPVVEYLEGTEVYDPIIPECLKSTWVTKYLPIFPYESDSKQSHYDLDRRQSIFVDLSTLNEARRRSSVLDRRMSDVLDAQRLAGFLEIHRDSATLGARRKSVLSTF